jgi:glycosyltransferase involved in cell wall biosynthesis
MRILVSAYTCRPGEGSEPGIGWNWVVQMCRFHDLWVITRTKNKPLVESQMLSRVRFCYVDGPRPLRFLRDTRITIWIYYYLWQIIAFLEARRLHRKVGFHLVHHVSLMSIRPSFAAFLGIPSIVGPVGGLQLLPPGLRSVAGHPIREGLREILIRKLRWSPLWKFYLRKVSVLIVANRACYEVIPIQFRSKVQIMQVGVSVPAEPDLVYQQHDRDGPLRIYWGGVLSRWKGLELLLRALAAVLERGYRLHLDVTGKGEDEGFFKKIVRDLNLESVAQFHGWLEREPQRQIMRHADIFVFTSLHETTGAILLEAMAYAKPVIVIDHAGPGDIVTSECAMKIKATGSDEVVRDMANAIELLVCDPKVRREMGEAARQRVREYFDWDKKGEDMSELYYCVTRSQQSNLGRE